MNLVERPNVASALETVPIGSVPKVGRRVLIADFDIYGQTGGGQTVYQKIIEQRPGDDFFYFVQREALDQSRPANAKPIPFEDHYTRRPVAGAESIQYLYAVYLEASNLAYSVAKAMPDASFDVVDTPDYRQLGIFLRFALEHHGLSIGTVVLALHGTISSAIRSHWPGGGNLERSVQLARFKEHLQFRTVESRYAISEAYRDEWRSFYGFNLPVHILDPLSIMELLEPQVRNDTSALPDLYFIGRREKCKGPDLFIDLVWSLPRSLFSKAYIIGGDVTNPVGESSNRFLVPMARRRGIDVEIVDQMPRPDVLGVFYRRSITLLPARRETFSLVALESLLRGCPTAISEGAGIISFLQERLPAVPYVSLPLSCAHSAVADLRDLLENYDARQQELVDAVKISVPDGDMESLHSLYEHDQAFDMQARDFARDQFTSFALYSAPRPHKLSRRVYRTLPQETRERIERVKETVSYREFETKIKARVDRSLLRYFGENQMCLREFKRIKNANKQRGRIAKHSPEETREQIDQKIAFLWSLVESRHVDRIRFFRELVRLERLRGNDLLAATYSLRIFRWLGRDRFGDLYSVINTLKHSGYHTEARAAHAMYDDDAKAYTRCEQLLKAAFEVNRSKNNNTAFEFIDDRRPSGPYKAAVIVSLYNAERYLPTFIEMLQQQTLIREGRVEVIFIDSGSPTNEYRVFLKAIEAAPFPAVFARSRKRETIQAAWNRGIALAQADYLTCLGVDEGIHPQCLEILAAELDDHPNIDWVMSGSIVTSVDREGVLDSDVMSYDRTGYRHEWHYLDCTFLGYVGGLYRRSVHDRFGYYDETFRAAGDTEFKNRVLPHIQTKYVPQVLGIFNDYPDERTTQHPRAEIEDLRAWYLHRTPAGVAYAFPGDDTEPVAALLRDTLRYRKCYCGHMSSDIDLALSLATHLHERTKKPLYTKLHQGLTALLDSYRTLELLPSQKTGRVYQLRLLQTWQAAKRMERKHQSLLGVSPAYDIFNDNRYEQHWWPWRNM